MVRVENFWQRNRVYLLIYPAVCIVLFGCWKFFSAMDGAGDPNKDQVQASNEWNSFQPKAGYKRSDRTWLPDWIPYGSDYGIMGPDGKAWRFHPVNDRSRKDLQEALVEADKTRPAQFVVTKPDGSKALIEIRHPSSSTIIKGISETLREQPATGVIKTDP